MARTFNGVDEYLSIVDATLVGQLVYPFTLAAWILPTSLASNHLVNISRSDASDWFYSLQLAAGGQITITANDGGASDSISSTTTTTAGVWAHGCGVFAGATARSVYLNGGGLQSSVVNVARSTGGSPNHALSVGAIRQSGSAAGFFPGRIAEVGVWNVGLSQAEVTALASRISPRLIRPSALVGYWPIFGVQSPEPDWGRGRSPLVVTGSPAKSRHVGAYYQDGVRAS